MTNLLPEKNKNEILREFFARLFVIFFIFFFCTVCIASASLIPSYVLSLVKETVVENENEKFDKTVDSEEVSDITTILEQEKRKLEILSGFEENNIIDLISDLVESKPKSIKIIGLFYDKEDNDGVENISLIVKGTATDRNILVGFIEELEKKNNFTEVDFPVSNLIQGESVDFSVKILIK